MIERDWYKCYGQGWGSLCIPDAYSHPAKFSRALIRHIYDHLFEQGYLHEGETIIDPFAGISLGALHAMQHGCHWIGVELEQKFVDMGSHYDCPGFTAEEWRRYHHRVDRVNNGPYHHWCPECVKAMRNVGKSRKIPMHGPHRYQGNIDLWMETYAPHFPKWGSAVLLQGDSRELAQVVGQVAGASVSSPPFSPDQPCASQTRAIKDYHAFTRGDGTKRDHIMRSPGNLDGMHATDADHAAALHQVAGAVSSPPWDEGSPSLPPERKRETSSPNDHGGPGPEYAQLVNPGNLGNLRTTSADHQATIQATVSSPPYTASLASDDPDRRGGLFRDPKRRSDKTLTAEYGESEGQLGAMPAGDHAAQVQASVSSPPYEKSLQTADEGDDNVRKSYPGWHSTGKSGYSRKYGNSDGQLGQEQGDTFWSAARTIVEQTYQVLAPGAVAVWVCKRFVRNKAIVNFSAQWAELCESVGFETTEWIKAWLTEDRGAQYTLSGDLEERQVKRCSFFRRLHESKYPDLAIDWEDVIIMRKPSDDNSRRIN